MQALLSFTSEARFLRYASKHLRQMFPVLPGQSGYTLAGVSARISQRLLALTTAIWHNDRIGAPVLRSLTAYDH